MSKLFQRSIENHDELEEALSQIKTYAEEMILQDRIVKLELTLQGVPFYMEAPEDVPVKEF